LHIGGRAADDVEHVAGRGLVFERFFEVARAGLQLAEQPRILHRDDRLVGKGAHQFNLPFGERLDPFPGEIDRAEHGPLAQEGHPKSGAYPGLHGLGPRVVRVSADVRDMRDPAFEQHPAGHAVAAGENGSLAQGVPILGLCSVLGHIAVDLALAYRDRREIGAAKPGGGFDHCVQHRLHIGGRAADDVEHIARRGLVFERFFEIAGAGLQFAEQPRILHRDDRLIGEGAHQFDLPLGIRLDPLPVKRHNADWLVVAQQRHREHGASPRRHSPGHREGRVGGDIGNMHDLAFERRTPDHGVATRDNGSLAQLRPKLGLRCTVRARHRAVDLALAY